MVQQDSKSGPEIGASKTIVNGLVWGKIYRKTPYLMGKSMVSCRFSLKSIDIVNMNKTNSENTDNRNSQVVLGCDPCPQLRRQAREVVETSKTAAARVAMYGSY
jgi:hypothetical protein